VGYWKGSGLSVVLDMIAAMMSLGRATHELSNDPLFEAGISQMFLALNPEAFGPSPRAGEIADEIVASLHGCKPAKEGGRVRYPGEQTLRVRAENEKLGLPVEAEVWELIRGL
jgi:3-dehydro-L-gulonate 2-dehydrogenase